MLRRVWVFNLAYAGFVAGVCFWFGTLFGLHWCASVAIHLQLYANLAVAIVGVFAMTIIVTLPISENLQALTPCQSEVPLLSEADGDGSAISRA
jgi:hypothetical protein